jgi:hypothetical protein
MMGFGILADVVLTAKAQWSDDGERHFMHTQLDRHGGEMTLEGEVHQGCMDNVVLMMAKGYLATA